MTHEEINIISSELAVIAATAVNDALKNRKLTIEDHFALFLTAVGRLYAASITTIIKDREEAAKATMILIDETIEQKNFMEGVAKNTITHYGNGTVN